MSDKSKCRFISAVNFKSKEEQDHAHKKARKATGKKRGFSKFIRDYVLADFNKASGK
jgi:hypothetical protein